MQLKPNIKAMNKKNPINKDNAREYQRRGVLKRKENAAKRKAMRELVLDELTKPVSEGSEMTKLEWLIAKAIGNVKDDISIRNLLELQELLGEKTTNNIVNITGHKPAEDAAREILDEIGE